MKPKTKIDYAEFIDACCYQTESFLLQSERIKFENEQEFPDVTSTDIDAKLLELKKHFGLVLLDVCLHYLVNKSVKLKIKDFNKNLRKHQFDS